MVIMAVAVFASLIFIRPSLWTTQLLSFFNSQLQERYNLRITASSLSGNILDRLNGEDVVVRTTQDSVLFTAEGLTLQYSPWKILLGEFALDEITIRQPVVYYNEGVQLLIRQMQPDTGAVEVQRESRQYFTIDRVSIREGQFIYQTTDQQLTMQDITGDMKITQSGEALTISGDFSSFQTAAPAQRLQGLQFELREYRDSVVIERVELVSDSASLQLNGLYSKGQSPRLSLTYDLADISFGTLLPKYGIPVSAQDQWRITGSLETDFDTLQTEVAFAGRYSNQVFSEGDFQLVASDSGIHSLDSHIRINGSPVNISGWFERGHGGELAVDMQELSLSPFLPEYPSMKLTGQFNLRERSGMLQSPDLLTTVSLDTAIIAGHDIRQLQGQLEYRDNSIHIVDSLLIDLTHTHAKLTGTYHLREQINGNINFFTGRFEELTAAFGLPKLYGEGQGQFQIRGVPDSTAVTGRIRMSDFGFRQFHFDSIAGFVDIGNVQQFRNGELFVNARNGEAWGQDITHASLSMEAREDSVVVHNLQLDQQDNHFYMTGTMARDWSGNIDTLELQYEDIVFQNQAPLSFRRSQGGVELSEGVISINEGRLSVTGQFRDLRAFDAQLSFADINSRSFDVLFPEISQFGGTINGTLRIRREGGNYAFQPNLELRNFSWRDLEYTEVALSGDYYQGLLTLNRGYFEHPSGGTVTISGKFPLPLFGNLSGPDTSSADASLSADMRFDHFELQPYSRYIPIREPIAGFVNGAVQLNGTMKSPGSHIDLTIQQPRFDRISGEELTVRARYADNTLRFTDMRLVESERGIYRGQGTLPLYLDFSDMALTIPRDRTMDMEFRGSTDHLQFLEQYVGGLDAITGEFNLNLSLTGTPADPVRDGEWTMRNTTLEIASLENEITGLSGRGVLQDNRMQIKSLTGYAYNPGERQIIEGAFNRVKSWVNRAFNQSPQRQEPNLTVTGTLDFTRFFQPGFDLQLQGEDVYIRTLLAEIEGVVDPDISLSGRDSLVISGEVLPEEVVLRTEFARQGPPREPPGESEGGRYVEYNLHTVFPGNFYIKNNQVNAEFEGDVWILRHGSEPVNFSGTLNVIRGKFYYYNDTFTIQEGQIVFDPVEFNPRLNIVAETTIENIPIIITLSGELDNPSINLTTGPDYQGTTLSESELLALMTFNPTQIEQEGKVRQEIQSIFTAYLARQLESYGSELIGLETFDVETDGKTLLDPEDVTIRVGRQVAPNLYFTFQREFFSATPSNRFGLEYQLNRYMSFIGEMDEEGLYHINYRLKYNY